MTAICTAASLSTDQQVGRNHLVELKGEAERTASEVAGWAEQKGFLFAPTTNQPRPLAELNF